LITLRSSPPVPSFKMVPLPLSSRPFVVLKAVNRMKLGELTVRFEFRTMFLPLSVSDRGPDCVVMMPAEPLDLCKVKSAELELESIRLLLVPKVTLRFPRVMAPERETVSPMGHAPGLLNSATALMPFGTPPDQLPAVSQAWESPVVLIHVAA